MDCPYTYMGQMGEKLTIRLQEQEQEVRLGDPNSLVDLHCNEQHSISTTIVVD